MVHNVSARMAFFHCRMAIRASITPSRKRAEYLDAVLREQRNGGLSPLPRIQCLPTMWWGGRGLGTFGRVAIEINGGIWSGGRHVRGTGYLRDREKVNAATALGWRVFELGTGQITPDHVQAIVDLCH